MPPRRFPAPWTVRELERVFHSETMPRSVLTNYLFTLSDRTLSEAEQLAAAEPLSGALLDIKLNSEEIWPVARILLDRGVPFIFCSGHFDRDSLPREWSTFPILTKPARARQIVERLAL